MRFIHAADFHVDSVYSSPGKANLEAEAEYQREMVWHLIHLARAQKVDAVLIAGDFIHARFMKEASWDVMVEALSGLGELPVLLVPGNHDPVPVYAGAGLPANVHIFGSEWGSVTIGGVEIWGRGWDGPGTPEPTLSDFPAVPTAWPTRRIVAIHGTAPVIPVKYGAFAPFSVTDLMGLGCCYLALGHHHRARTALNSETGLVACYPGAVRGSKSEGDQRRTVIVADLEGPDVSIRHFGAGANGFVRAMPPASICLEV